jgi:hypothetical protein
MLDPFQLLGITANATVGEARKAYLQLAKLCHPDRGGHPEDMHILRAAYQWVAQQLDGVAQRDWEQPTYAEGMTVAGMKEIIAESIGMDQDAVVKMIGESIEYQDNWFRKIALDHVYTRIYAHLLSDDDAAVDIDTKIRSYIKEFVERYEDIKSETMAASLPGGYGADMISCIDEKTVSFGTQEIIVYKEPNPMMVEMGTSIVHDEKGFGTERLADYKEAMKSAVKLDVEREPEDVEDALERMRMARDLQDKLVIKPARVFLGVE